MKCNFCGKEFNEGYRFLNEPFLIGSSIESTDRAIDVNYTCIDCFKKHYGIYCYKAYRVVSLKGVSDE